MFFQVQALGQVEQDPELHIIEDGKQGLSFEVNVEKFSFAGGSELQESVQQSGLCLDNN